MSAPEVKCTSAPPARLWSVEAEIASVYHTGEPHNRDPIMYMIHAVLDDNKDMNPDNSIIVKMKLNTTTPEKYSGSLDLEAYKISVAGILHSLKMNGLHGIKHDAFQVEYLGI